MRKGKEKDPKGSMIATKIMIKKVLPVTHAKGAVPDVGLAEEGAHLLVVADFLKQIPTVSILRDNAQTPVLVTYS